MTQIHLLTASKDSITVLSLSSRQIVANIKVQTHQLRISISQNGILTYSSSLINGTINFHKLYKDNYIEDSKDYCKHSINRLKQTKMSDYELGSELINPEIECKNQLLANKNYPISKIGLSSDGGLLLTTSSHQNKIKVYNVSEKRLISTLMPSPSCAGGQIIDM